MSTNAKNNQNTLQELRETYYNSQSEGKDFDWFSIKEKAIRDYQSDELTED